MRLNFKTPFLVAACLLTTFTPLPSNADSASDKWQWGATIYMWLPSIGGETSFPPDGDGPSIDISGDQILDSLNFAFMGSVEGRKDAWAIATDVIYLDFGATEKASRDFSFSGIDVPASVDADLRFGIQGWLWTLIGSYATVQRDDFTLDVLAGVRMLHLQEDLRWSLNGDISSLPLPGRDGSSKAEDTVWDAIVGLKGRARFGADRNWYVPYHLDVGTGESDITWQGMVGLGYSFNSIEVTGAWRYLDYDLGSHAPIQSIDFNGPALGITFRF